MKVENKKTRIKIRFQQVVYFFILLGLILFVLRQGKEPWLILISHWLLFLIIVFSTSMAIFVQAGAFRWCLAILNAPKISFPRIVRAWSIGGLTGLIAPFITGLAVRVLLLKREGIDLKIGGMATLYQAVINIEYAFLLLVVVLIFHPLDKWPWLGWMIAVGWSLWQLVKFFLLKNWLYFEKTLSKLSFILQPPPVRALPWLWGQIVFLTLNYWLAFNFFGVFVTWAESALITAASILVSVAFFIPNGLGILDIFWFSIAKHHGVGLDESVSLVLILRLGHLTAALILWITIDVFGKIQLLNTLSRVRYDK